MKIQKIQLQNFKRFQDLTIDLGSNPKRVVALVGKNGCGKSSILEGIFCWYRKSTNNIDLNKRYPTMILKNPGVSNDVKKININISVEFANNNTQSNDNAKTNITHLAGSNIAPIIFRNIMGVTSRVDQNKDTFILVDNGKNKQQIRLNTAYLAQKYPQLVLPTKEKDNPKFDPDYPLFKEMYELFKDCLNLDFYGILPSHPDHNVGYELYFSKPDYVFQDTISFGFSNYNLSDGEREAVDILLDIKLNQTKYQDTILLFDEPELHLHTSIQSSLLKSISQLIGDNSQIWIATHSIGFMRTLQTCMPNDCQIIELNPDTKLASSVVHLEALTPKEVNWRNLFTVALDELAELTMPHNIILCEGLLSTTNNGKDKGFDAEIYNNIFGSKYPDILFVSAGGCGDLKRNYEGGLFVLRKMFTNQEMFKFSILKDRDLNNNNKPKNSHGIPERVLSRREIENFLCDPEVLQAYATDMNYSFNLEKFQSIICNDLDNFDVKKHFPEIFKECFSGFKIKVQSNSDQRQLKKTLSNYIKPGMKVYRELEVCAFGNKNK